MTISSYTENQEDLKLSGKGKSIDVNTEMTEMLGSSDKNLKKPE